MVGFSLVSHLLLIVDMYKDEERWLVGKDHQAGQCKHDAIKQNNTKICNKARQCKYEAIKQINTNNAIKQDTRWPYPQFNEIGNPVQILQL